MVRDGLDPGEIQDAGLNIPRPSADARHWRPPTPEELATFLPQYQIESLLGHGGMGAVYKGLQPDLDRPVAIKLLPEELAADEQFVSRFRREARMLARLQHPGIVTIHGFGQTEGGHLYFVMEFVEGTDLDFVIRGPCLDQTHALALFSQICEALEYAHGRGVIHRDVKPANMLITSEGRVKVADFGLARPLQVESTELTAPHVVIGTRGYMAPEQFHGTADQRSDIFALGVTLYELLTGQRPRGSIEPPLRKRQIDGRLDAVFFKALQRDPARRYDKVGQMKMDVDHILGTLGKGGTPSRKINSFRTLIALRSEFLLCLLSLLAAFILKIAFAQTSWGREMEQWVCSKIQNALSGAVLSRANELLIVDISSIRPQPAEDSDVTTAPNPPMVTPRNVLTELISRMAEQKPRVIGVDLDFSGWDDGRPVTQNDFSFFNRMKELSEIHGVPIYLGVSRQRWKDGSLWLGDRRFQKLAAGIEVPEEPDVRFYARWLRGAGVQDALPNLPLALAGRADETGRDAHHGFWSWAVRASELRRALPPFREAASPGIMSWALVDFGALHTFADGFSNVINVQSLTDNKQRIRDRIVLVGDASEPQPHDHFNVGNPRLRPIAGIYMHACATLTAMGDPILTLTYAGRVSAYLAAAILAAGGISVFLRCQLKGIQIHPFQSKVHLTAVTLLAIVAMWLVAAIFSVSVHVVWTDFIAVTFGLLLYLGFSDRLNHWWSGLREEVREPSEGNQDQTQTYRP